ncbi:uncharacterized protein LOC116307981 [Actinia tenebrosa]|uniref:Uncharacterized protein LOC116307981 n=1 Tax=Actinia tenebrosa TaxID=6105 RepID=A0A6P8J3J2_ACTTE|nr:uncharacterized protein LOC116307981 [Actinia tenebrosa]
MLRRVVVENYVIFKGRHELDFDGKEGRHFYTFVGENASGKSSLVALIKAACNLQDEGPDFEVITNGKGESKAVCHFEFSNGKELVKVCEESCATAGQATKLSVGLSSWFCDELIKIPSALLEPIKMACRHVNSKLDLLVGHRHQPIGTQYSRPAYDPELDPLCNSQFLYIIMDDGIFVATKSEGIITTGFHELLPEGVNPMDWIPQHSFLLNVIKVPYIAEGLLRNASCSSLESVFQCNFANKVALEPTTEGVAMETVEGLQSDVDGGIIGMMQGDGGKIFKTGHCETENASPKLERRQTAGQRHSFKRMSSFGGLAWSNYHELKKIIVLDLLRGFPPENWSDIHVLFHEIIGSKSISFELNTQNLPQESFKIVDTKTGRVMRRIPEGLFTAFIIAALLVKPGSRNVILDEPTRGMHPLQTRRLRNILMRESVKRRKCIIAASHSPELLDVDRITLIWRFQLLPDGYCQIRRVTAKYTERELLFIGGAEVREIFFSRHIIWVEGESDKRFIEALLGLFDEGQSDLWKVLTEHCTRTLLSREESATTDGRSPSRSPSPRPFPHTYDTFIATLFQDPAYERQYFTDEQLSLVQEAVRSCKVVSIGGKKNLWKGAGICRDLRIPFAVICDLDAIVPNSRENSILSQFEKCDGNWEAAKIPHAKTRLVDEEESPASKAIDENDRDRIAKLKSLRYVGDVMRFYDKELYFFTWRLMGGEIEDAVRLTRAQFGKKLWPDMLSAELKELIISLLDPRKLLLKDPKSKEATKQPNLEILRCIYFLIRFFRETLQFKI